MGDAEARMMNWKQEQSGELKPARAWMGVLKQEVFHARAA